MNQKIVQAILIIITITGLFTLPALADRDNPIRPMPDRDSATLAGKIISLDKNAQQVGLALYVHVANPRAPGKIPDEFAMQAAALYTQADQFDKQGKTEEAKRARAIADELLRWREIEYTAKIDRRTPLIGLRRVGMGEVPNGTRLRLIVGTPGPIQPNKIPDKLRMVKDAIQVAGTARSIIREVPRNERMLGDISFLEVVGEVVNLKPFTVKVDNNLVRIETPPEFGCLHQRVLKFDDLQVGQRVLSRVRMEGERNVKKLNRLIVLLDGKETLISPEDDLEA